MTAKQLKNSILQQAIQGKLIKQNKEDEPASKLLKRIKAEREKLIKSGKIKVNKNISAIYRKGNSFYEKIENEEICIDEELPFAIPKTWEWVRLYNISKNITAGGDKPNKFSKCSTKECSIPVLSNGEKDFGLFGYTDSPRITEHSITVSGRGTIGFSCVRRYPYTPIVRLICIIPMNIINLDYLQIVLTTLLEKGVGTSIKQLTVPMLSPKLIPLPPIEEQKRIVNKLNQLMPLIEEYEEKENKLNELDKKFPERLKKSILKEAVEGKLINQNKKDKPASELLKRIKAEREKLIKSGKIKVNKNISAIYRKGNSFYEKIENEEICIDEELPFEIPKTWEWTKLSFVSDMFTGNSINENEKNLKYKGLSEGYFYVATKDVNFNNEIDYYNGVRIPKNSKKFRIAPKNSILFCVEGGSAGKKIAITDKDICFGNKLCCFVSYGIDIKYLYYYIQSPMFIYDFKRNTTGIIGGVSINTLKQMFLPLPPIEEQKRIVEKLDKLINACEELKKILFI